MRKCLFITVCTLVGFFFALALQAEEKNCVVSPVGSCTRDINECGNPSRCECLTPYVYNSAVGKCVLKEEAAEFGEGYTDVPVSKCVEEPISCTRDINYCGNPGRCSCSSVGFEWNGVVGKCVKSTDQEGKMACVCTASACGNNAIGGNRGDIFTNVSEAAVKQSFQTNPDTGWTCFKPEKVRGSGGPEGCFCKDYCGNGGVGANPNFIDLGLSSSTVSSDYGGGNPGNRTGWLCGAYRGKFN